MSFVQEPLAEMEQRMDHSQKKRLELHGWELKQGWELARRRDPRQMLHESSSELSKGRRKERVLKQGWELAHRRDPRQMLH
jgi:hypothetical protein